MSMVQLNSPLGDGNISPDVDLSRLLDQRRKKQTHILFFVDRNSRDKTIGCLRNRRNRLHGQSAHLDTLGPWPSSPGACAPDLARPSA